MSIVGHQAEAVAAESPQFRPFTRQSLANIEARIAEREAKRLAEEGDQQSTRTAGNADLYVPQRHIEDRRKPDKKLEQGLALPRYLERNFPSELIATPIEDIDPFYLDTEPTFVVVSKGKDIFRFSATKSVYLLDPFNPVRRVAIYMLVHPLFSFLVIVTILVNCFIMTQPPSPAIEQTEIIFTTIYTFESCLKVTARGFITTKFTYLRDPWNWLDFVVIALAYLTMFIKQLGNLSALRTFRVLRALKTVAIIPGMKTIVGAVIESAKNLKDVIILTCFSLSVFALLGLQIYMGVLTQKCMKISDDHEMNDTTWFQWHNNTDNWYRKIGRQDYLLCGNASGAQPCPTGYMCMQGFGGNPNYDYTNFDTFGWALLSAFRLMTQDAWEILYQQVLRVTGPAHIVFFIAAIFLGSIYLMNLILAIVAMSYDELQKNAENEALEIAAEEAAYQDSQRQYDEDAQVARQERFDKAAQDATGNRSLSSSSPDNEKPASIDDNMGRKLSNGRVRKASLSFPGSPFDGRRRSSQPICSLTWARNGKKYGDRKPLVLDTSFHVQDQDQIPFADADSGESDQHNNYNNTHTNNYTNATPTTNNHRHRDGGIRYFECDEDGCDDDEQQNLDNMDGSDPLIAPKIVFSNSSQIHSRHSSYTSHSSRHSYSSIPGAGGGGGGGDIYNGDARGHKGLPNWTSTKNHHRSDSLRHSRMISPGQPLIYHEDLLLDPEQYLRALKPHRSSENPFIEKPEIKHTFVDMKDPNNPGMNDMFRSDVRRKSSRKISVYYFNDDEEDEDKPTFREKLLTGCLRIFDMFCVWDCCWCWVRLQEIFALIVFDAFMELFITLCIVVNTLFMAMDHHDMDYDFEKVLKAGNYFFTATFAVEALLKLLALSPKFYFREGWNIFDFVIVFLSLLELGLENVSGLSVLRSFRLLRVFKLAKSWPTLNLLISIMGKTVGDLGNLTFVLGIIIFIFAVMGMQLFGSKYDDNKDLFFGGEIPRWNFKDFMHSFMIVFRVLCGEWIESMWDCMLVAGAPCVPFFLATVVIGNLVVLNLFLALLLSSFGASNLSAPSSESADTKKLQEAFDRFSRAHKWIKKQTMAVVNFFICRKAKNQISDRTADIPIQVQVMGFDSKDASQADLMQNSETESAGHKFENSAKVVMNQIRAVNSLKPDLVIENDIISLHSSQNMDSKELEELGAKIDPNGLEVMDADRIETATADVIVNEYPVDCFPDKWYEKCPWCLDETPWLLKWKELRYNSYNLVENKYFETVCITLILISSMTLALEDVHLKNRKWLQDVLVYVDKFFTIIFMLEMLLKWVAYGFKAYFTNAWCWLDFLIVMVSLFNLAVGLAGFGNIPAFKTMRTLRALRPLRAMSRLEGMRVSAINFIASLAGMGKIQAFKTMRTLRALRPLRAMSKMQGMRVVVNALVQAIPAIANVLLVCLIFWLIFAIMGVQMFAGKFFSCNKITEAGLERVPVEVAATREDCRKLNSTEYIWTNPQVNFDNVLNGYLCLFQVATFKGWIDIMNHAIDSRDIDEQPQDEVNIFMYLYFVFFIIFGSFFTLNLFIGVIIDNFNEQKKKAGGSLEMFMTEDQKKYYNAMKKMGSKKPAKAIPRPRFKLQAIIFDVTTNKKFDMTIMLFIGLNMLIMALDSYRQSEIYAATLEKMNLFFIAVFAAECFLKIFALRIHYFKEPWNVFDFVVVMLSIAGVMLKDLIAAYFVSPTLLRVVRVVKVGRVLRLVKGARGIRTLLFALAMSLPALFNICLLLFLVMFIYAIFGMSFFMNVKQRYGIDETFNFGTFFKSFILLFQICTSAGWDSVLAAIMDDTDCNKVGNEEEGTEGDCGSKGIAIAYICSYLVISFLVILNMYIAVILENYSQATEDVEQGLTDDDYDMYYEIWQKFDPRGTQFIPYSALSDFLDALEAPLQIPKPNKIKIVTMDIPICKDDMCYCVEILDALTKDFFARKGAAIEETQELAEIAPLKGQFEHVSSTMWRQREEYAARVIQGSWRKWKSSSCKDTS